MSDDSDYGDDLFGEAPEPVSVAILGSTGSIGTQALEVVRAHPSRFKVTALTANSDAETLLAQAREFDVRLLGLTEAPGQARGEAPIGATLIDGPMASAEVAEAAEASVVLNAVVGAAGLQATLATLRAGKTLALANKESLVAAGELVMAKAGPGQIRPVDSDRSGTQSPRHGKRGAVPGLDPRRTR
jgi:1-deoxy-D-xylulose-5-phosphate reductoisomerase